MPEMERHQQYHHQQMPYHSSFYPPFVSHRRGGAAVGPSSPPLRLPGDGGGGCLARTPFASLCAFLCCLCGVLLFGTMMAWAFTASVEQTRRALRVNHLPWLDKVYLLFLVSACLMVVVSLAFLLIGLLSTGPTRHAVFNTTTANSCHDAHRLPIVEGDDTVAFTARRSGRISCVVAICLSFLLNLLWTTIAIFTAILCFLYTILFLLCSSADDCLDLGVLGPLLDKPNNSLKFCSGELQQFCAVTNTVVVWYFVGLSGAIVVCVGLVQFIASNAANYAHIGSEAKYAELRHLFYSEICDNGSGNDTMPLEDDLLGIIRHPNYNNNVMQGKQARQQQQHFMQQQTANNLSSAKRRNLHSNSRWEASETVDCRRQQRGRNGVKLSQPPYEYQRHSNIEKRAPEKRSVGAMVGSVRRNSYQNSLHGSNNWLNYAVDAAGPDTLSSPVAVAKS